MDVGDVFGRGEKGSDLGGGEAGDAAADLGDQEGEFRVEPGEIDELIYVGFDGIGAAVHGRDGVRLALQAHALAPYGSEFFHCQQGGASAVGSGKVAAKNKDLSCPEPVYAGGRCAGGRVKVAHDVIGVSKKRAQVEPQRAKIAPEFLISYELDICNLATKNGALRFHLFFFVLLLPRNNTKVS